jgi:tryptophanyl-tRNA synthetase
MVTDPARIKKTDPGHPEVCIVHTYHNIYRSMGIEELQNDCRQGKIGCVECKKQLAALIDEQLAPIREKRNYYENKPELMKEILAEGARKARNEAKGTMELVRKAMNI